jgi:predicted O-linked N-acetylglucosamine transferase (SPINDLY family)
LLEISDFLRSRRSVGRHPAFGTIKMNLPSSIANSSELDRHAQAVSCFEQGDHTQASDLWQEAIAADETQVGYYWYLGLALLLQNQEAEAQLTWMTPLLEAEPSQIEQWTADLTEILENEADRQAANGAIETAWLIRQHLGELNPDHLPNLLQGLLLGLKLEPDSIAEDALAQATQALCSRVPGDFTQTELLLRVVQQLLEFEASQPAILELVEACVPHCSAPDLAKVLAKRAEALFFGSQSHAAATLIKICLRLTPDNLGLFPLAIPVLQGAEVEDVWLSVRIAEQFLAQAVTLSDKILAGQHLLSGLMLAGGHRQRAVEVYQAYKLLLADLVQAQQDGAIDPGSVAVNLTAGSVCFYFEDQPRVNRPLRNQIGAVTQANVVSRLGKTPYAYLRSAAVRPLKVGYLSKSLRQHSIGWLIRWLLKYHHSDRVEVHLYSTRNTGDPLQQSFMTEFGDRFHAMPEVIPQIADQIHQDAIDVLIELDSLTSYGGCSVTCLKPAPVQVNWLGFDAAGLPAIDYFIADPYVLPDAAQDYYSEKIWRLPHTYIAVDGFEVGTPSLRRDQLDIPSEAIVYLSSQTGMKRNPANVRLQMQILRAVPNSYFLVKSLKSDEASLVSFFSEIAEEVGVSGDRLRFLPRVDSEAVHRGNIGIADVVLDTFPYTGATTTLETLWMGIPLVTRVGEQFAARNSYTMLMNVGVTEGIAWTDEQYLEWGIRLGEDEALRQQIAWKLQRSRHTSPLWNARQFAQEMETAYEQMWARYCEG